MMIYGNLKAWLFGCRAKTVPDDEFGSYYCTLRKRHVGPHEAWTCTCLCDGRCADYPMALAETWSD